MEESWALFPSEQQNANSANNKPIPSGTQVRFRWHHSGGVIGMESAAVSVKRNSLENVWHRPAGWTKLVGTIQDSTPARHISPPHFSGQIYGGLLDSSGESSTTTALSVLSTGILLLLFLVGFCLVRCLLQRVKAAKNRPISRELQIVLVPKRRPCSLLLGPAMAPTVMSTLNLGQHQNNHKDNNNNDDNCSRSTINTTDIVGTIGRWLPKASQNSNENAKGQKPLPLPRRIYELQAEEGYFSCPPSKRASFEIDCR